MERFGQAISEAVRSQTLTINSHCLTPSRVPEILLRYLESVVMHPSHALGFVSIEVIHYYSLVERPAAIISCTVQDFKKDRFLTKKSLHG